MTNAIKILNNNTLSEITTIENIITPLVYEEINASYTFSFEVDYRHKGLFVGNNIIDVEGQYFRPTRIMTDRGYGVSVSVDCEHVSYDLIDEEDETEEYEDMAVGMISNVLSGTPFEVGSIVDTPSAYYKPSSKIVRQRLFDIANLFGTELIFDNFTVHMVYRRGINNSQQFKLGENLVSVREEIDNTTGMTAYDVDVVDLSKVPGYEFLMSIGLGDTVEVVDPLAGIYTTQRVLSRQYNPFTKINPRVQIGNLIRDFTDYIREKEEEKEEEEDPTLKYWLSTFMIDDISVLDIDGVDSSYGAYVEVDTIPGSVTIAVKEQYQKYFIGVIVEQNGKGEKLFLDDDFTNGSLTINSPYTSAFLKGTVKIAISDKPLNTPRADVQTFIADINLINNIEKQLLEYFLIDTDDVLYSPGIDTVEGAEHLIYDQVQRIKLKLIDNIVFDFVNVGLYNGSERVETYDYSHFKEGVLSINTRSQGYADGLKIVVNVKQGEENIYYTVRCVKEVEEDEPIDPFDSWLSEFRIGNVNCLDMPGIMVDSFNDELVELNYTKSDEYKGLFLQLHEKYREAAIVVSDENGNNINYNDSLILPGERKKLLITLSLADEKQYYGLNFVRTDFKGLIIIKSYDEDGNLIVTKEKKYTQTGVYEITADEIDGYYLMSEKNVKVELTVYDNEHIVEFTYKNLNGEGGENGGGGISNSPYVLEFGTAPVTSNVNFAFSREYNSIESVTLGVMSNLPAYMNKSWEPITNISGKYIGVKIIVNPVVSGKSISVHAVCKR